MRFLHKLIFISIHSLKRLPLLLFITLYFSLRVVSQTYPYKFNHLTVDEGLSHTDANDIAQDQQGYIWVATYFGLDRFDGYSVKQYYNDNHPLDNAFKNRLRCIYPDNDGNIWLSSEQGIQCFNSRLERYVDLKESNGNTFTFDKLYKPAGKLLYGLAGNQLKIYLIKGRQLIPQRVSIPNNLQVFDMATDLVGTLFLATNEGLWRQYPTGEFVNIGIAGLTGKTLTRIYFDHNNNLLFSTDNRLFSTVKYPGFKNRQDTQAFKIVSEFICPDNNFIKNITEDNSAHYWLNAGPELIRMDQRLKPLQFLTSNTSAHSLNSNSLSKIYIDRSQCLWVCTFGGGVNYCDLNEKLFYTLQHNTELPNSLSGNHIRSVMANGDDLWIGTTANGLNRYNLKTQTFTYFNTRSTPVKLKSETITSLTLDNGGNLWIGSQNGLDILKPNGKALWKPPGYKDFPNYVLETLAMDCYGNIWFGNHMNRFGVIWKDSQSRYHVKYYGEGYFILADQRRPQLFISSTHGLKRVLIDAQGNMVKTVEYTASSNSNSLSSNYTYPICEQNDSTYWIGTIGGGLDRLFLKHHNAYTITSFTHNYGVFNDVESLEIDHKGNIWMGGNGLECLSPVTGKLIRYDKNDGLQGNSFKVGASYQGTDGRLYFGGINGLNYFYPDQITANAIAAHPIITDILINNKKIAIGNPDSAGNTISQNISYTKNLTLSYLQNNFVIFFSAMHFANPLKCKYRYKLRGFDKEWKYSDGKNPSAAYSNLDYANYTFELQATNNDGIWSGTEAELSVTISPPWWKSNLAKTFSSYLWARYWQVSTSIKRGGIA
jgi:ligand-binding sensor domain-containing protein